MILSAEEIPPAHPTTSFRKFLIELDADYSGYDDPAKVLEAVHKSKEIPNIHTAFSKELHRVRAMAITVQHQRKSHTFWIVTIEYERV